MRVPSGNIQTYQRSVSLGAMPNARVDAPGDANAYGANVAQAIAGVGAKLGAAAEVQQQKENYDAVTEASNAMSADMLNYFNGDGGIFSRKGENAKGSVDEAKKFMADLSNKYYYSLKNKDQQRAFAGHMRENSYNYMRSAATHERNELEIARTVKFNASIDLNAQAMAANYTNTEMMGGFIQKGEREIDARAFECGIDANTAAIQKTKANTKGIKGAFSIAMSNGQYDAAENILSTFKGKVDPVAFEEMNGTLRKVRIKQENFSAVDSIIQSTTRPDGSVDTAAANRMLRDRFGPKETQGVDESQWRLSGADKPDVGNLPGSTKRGVAQIWGTLNGLDSGVSITSGYRDQERNKAAGGVDGSNHTDGGRGAVDFAFSRELSQEEQDGIANKARANGWKEVLWHDAGSGYHLHLGDYQGEGEGGGAGGQGFDADRYSSLQSKLNARIADMKRIKVDRDAAYKRGVAEQIASAESLEDAYGVIDDAEDLTLEMRNSLKGAARSRFNASTSGSAEQKMWAGYEKKGFFIDSRLMEEYRERVGNGEEIVGTQQSKYNMASRRLNEYYNFISKGAYGEKQQADQARARYDEIMADLWSSKTKQERMNKANGYAEELNQIGQALDLNVNNDVQYILGNKEG